eukprot:2303426-Prymnesium_polylepis.1
MPAPKQSPNRSLRFSAHPRHLTANTATLGCDQPLATSLLRASMLAAAADDAATPQLDSSGEPPNCTRQQPEDVAGTKLRQHDTIVLLGSQDLAEYHGVVCLYFGPHFSATGMTVKVTRAMRGGNMERLVWPAAMVRCLQHHKRQWLALKLLTPRTLHATELIQLGLPSSAERASWPVVPEYWTLPRVRYTWASDGQVEETLAKIEARIDRMSFDPSTVCSHCTGRVDRSPTVSVLA